MKYKVTWIKISTDTEWLYFGAGADVNEEMVVQKITAFYPDGPFVFAIDRKQSAAVLRNELKNFLQGILGYKDFFIWDSSFKHVMEFSHIGVMRQGFI